MMKFMTRAIVGLFLLSVGSASHADVVDQFNLPTFQVVTSIANDELAAQTFSAGLSGQLNSIDLYLGQFGGTAPLVVEVRSVSSGLPSNYSGDVLGRAALPVDAIPETYPGGWVTLDFLSEGVFLNQGTTYAIVLSRSFSDFQSIAWWGGLETYAGGNFFFMQPAGIPSFANWYEPNAVTHEHIDMGFRTNMVAVPIPEPETYAMMLAGLGLLGIAARRRKLKSAA